jgi:xanthine dehydrogenase accessory factor
MTLRFWAQTREVIRSRGGVGIVTVLDVQGSVPRERGARLVVAADGSFTGTIGGGALEWEAIEHARARLDRRQVGAEIRAVPLGPSLGQCCGGRVEMVIETLDRAALAWIDALAAAEASGDPLHTIAILSGSSLQRKPLAPEDALIQSLPPGEAARRLEDGRILERFGEHRWPLALFGAGHVGRALVLALAPLPFRVNWIDSRADPFPAMVPANVALLNAQDPIGVAQRIEPGSLALVMTHSHPLDLALCDALLQRPDIPWIGLIGSETKRARFLSRLGALGHGESALSRLACPIGVPGIHGKAPAVIAASTVAQLLQVTEEIAGEKARARRAWRSVQPA